MSKASRPPATPAAAATKPPVGPARQLRVKVFSPYQVFYEGPARSLSARNQVGAFDVLYDHVNFFSLLAAGDVTVDISPTVDDAASAAAEPLIIPITRGLIKVADNTVVLFVNV